jgi:lysophospholipase L1-like esterase
MKRFDILFYLAGLSVLLCCSKSSMTKPDKALTYLALGDSYTIGESVPVSDRYPNQLVALLKANGIIIDPATIIAKTGWTTFELKAEMDRQNIYQTKYDYVSLLIGVNNQYRGLDREQYRKEFKGLLDDAVALAKGKANKVFVISIPDWGVTPFGKQSTKPNISQEIDRFNAINKEETVKAGVAYIDITPGSRKASIDLSLVAEDGLHPSGKMYKEWANAILAGFKF